MLALVSCVSSDARHRKSTGLERYDIPKDDLPRTLAAAESGDRRARNRLYLYYSIVKADGNAAARYAPESL